MQFLRKTLDWVRYSVVLSVVLAVQLSAIGCNGSESNAESAPDIRDPRMSSADSLVEYYNSLNTVEPVRAHETMKLFYAENKLQKQLISMTRQMISVAELDYTLYERFGRGLEFSETAEHMLMPDEPARITSREDQRASATFKSIGNEQRTLYLVKIGDEWRVSGYTLEYDPELLEGIEDLDAFEETVKHMSKAADEIVLKVRADVYQTLDEARTAFSMAWLNEMAPDGFPEVPE